MALGALSAGAFRARSAAWNAEDGIICDSATGALCFFADGNGGVAAVRLATLQSGLGMSAADCILVT